MHVARDAASLVLPAIHVHGCIKIIRGELDDNVKAKPAEKLRSLYMLFTVESSFSRGGKNGVRTLASWKHMEDNDHVWLTLTDTECIEKARHGWSWWPYARVHLAFPYIKELRFTFACRSLSHSPQNSCVLATDYHSEFGIICMILCIAGISMSCIHFIQDYISSRICAYWQLIYTCTLCSNQRYPPNY